MDYYNHNPQTESHYEYVINRKESLVISPEQAKQQAFVAMSQLEGWCSQEKASLLMDLIFASKPKTLVEIGVFGGKSLIPMAYALKANEQGKIYGIDPWESSASIEGAANQANKEWWSALNHEAIRQGLINKIKLFALEKEIELIKSSSADAVPISEIDLLHIDGNHSDATSYLDVTKWVPLVASGGWIVFDDLTWHENGVYTTARAVEWLNANCIKFAEFTDSCTWGVWIKP